MDLDPTDEQRLLAETVNGLLDARYDARTRLRLLDSDLGWSRDMWARYADLGLLGLGVGEQYGGAGMGVAELATVMECFGRHLVLEPYVPTVLLGAALINAAGTPEQRGAIMPAVVAGRELLAFAYTEPGSRWSLDDPATTATADGAGWSVSGEKIAVLGADTAHQLVVSARTDEGVGLFLVAASDTTLFLGRMQDGQRAAGVLLSAAPATLVGTSADALKIIESVLDVATVTLCAEAVGMMDWLLWSTVGYLRTRVQFSTPISVFQALQHRAADMYVALEQARSMALLARNCFTAGDPAQRRQAVRAAKIQVDQSGRLIGQEAIQLHGAIGMTMEYPVSHYAKRLEINARTFADTSQLLSLVGAHGGLVPVD